METYNIVLLIITGIVCISFLCCVAYLIGYVDGETNVYNQWEQWLEDKE